MINESQNYDYVIQKIFKEFLAREQTCQLNSGDIKAIIDETKDNSTLSKRQNKNLLKDDEKLTTSLIREFIHSKKSDKLNELGQIDILATLEDYKKIIAEADIKDDRHKLQLVGACIENIAEKIKDGLPQITPDTANEFIKSAGIKSQSIALEMMKDTDINAEIKGQIIEKIKSDSSYLASSDVSPTVAASNSPGSPRLPLASNLKNDLSLGSSSRE